MEEQSMKTILRAAIAIGIIYFVAHFLEQSDNVAQLKGYKDEFMQTKTMQAFLNSEPIQKLQNFNIDEIATADFF